MQILQIPMSGLFSEGVNVEKAASVLNVEAAEAAGSSFIEIVNALLKGVEMEAQNAAAGQEPEPTQSFGLVETAKDDLKGAEIIAAAPMDAAASETPSIATKDMSGLLEIIGKNIEENSGTITAGSEVEAVQDNAYLFAVNEAEAVQENAGLLAIENEAKGPMPSGDELDRALLFGELLPATNFKVSEIVSENTLSAAPVSEMQDAYEILNDTADEIDGPEKETFESEMTPLGDDYYSHEVLAALSVLKQAFLKSSVPFENAVSTIREYYKNAPVETGIALENTATADDIVDNEISFDGGAAVIDAESEIDFEPTTGEAVSAGDEAIHAQATVAPFEPNNPVAGPLENDIAEAIEPARIPEDFKTSNIQGSINETSHVEPRGTETVKTETPEIEPSAFKNEEKEIGRASYGKETVKTETPEIEPSAFKNEEKETGRASYGKETVKAEVAVEAIIPETGREPRQADTKTENITEPRHGAHRGIEPVSAEKKASPVFSFMPEQPEKSIVAENIPSSTPDAKIEIVHTAEAPVKTSLKTFEIPAVGDRQEAEMDPKAMEMHSVSKDEGSAGFDAENGGYESAQGYTETVKTDALNTALPNAAEKFSLEAVKETKAPAQATSQAPATGNDIFEKLGESIRLSVKENGGEVRMTLKPESLGELRIKMNVENSAVKAEIIVDSHAVRSMLETDSAALRDAFSQQGLTLDKYTIEVSGAGNSGHSTEERGSAPERNREGFREFGGGRERDGASERQNPRKNPFERDFGNERSIDFFA